MGTYEYLWFTFNQMSGTFIHFQWDDNINMPNLTEQDGFNVMLIWQEIACKTVSKWK